jgi:3-hydroxy-9,10-secoandrosta-1,3,5(10)-triene-9,17-dione monooxygenase
MVEQTLAVTREPNSTYFVEKAAAVVRQTDHYAAEADQDRRLPDAAVDVLVKSGLIKLLRPRRLGGHEVDPTTYMEVGRELGTGLPALAWVFQVMSIHEWYMAFANPELQDEIWASDDDALVVDSVAPVGRAVEVPGGFRVDGRWKFLSGIEWCSWVAVNAMTELPDGTGPEPCMYFIPRAEIEIIDDWHTVAMRGSASRSALVDDVFVPAHRMFPFARTAASGRPQGPVTDAGPLYRVPFTPMLSMAIFPAALGIAERALKEFRTWTTERVRPFEKGARQKDAPAAQIALAEASVRLEAAHALARRYTEALWDAGVDGPCADDPATRAQYFAWRAYIGRTCADIVERLFLESGANALFETHPMQLLWRESHAAAQHVSLQYGDAMTSYGRNLVGLQGHPLI